MIRMLFMSFLIIFASPLFSSEIAKNETDARRFYEEFRRLVLANNRVAVAELFKYPFTNSIATKDDLIDHYDEIFSERLNMLVECTDSSYISKVGWRGYMLLNGTIWLDGVYFGNIHPVKGSPFYVDDIAAQIDDKEHWYMRIHGVNQNVGECPKPLNKSKQQGPAAGTR